MALCEYDDQFVPTLTPCSAASLRLKNMRLPRTQSRLGLPKEIMTVTATALLVKGSDRSPIRAKAVIKIALQYVRGG